MQFGEKLELAMKKLSLSRADLASAVGVDKSVAGRWVSGKVKPSANNLAKISRVIAEHVQGFTMLDWERDLDAFSLIFGGNASPVSSTGNGSLFPLLPEKLAKEAMHSASERSKAYEGIWQTTRPSSDLPGKFLQDVTISQRNSEGFLDFRSGVEGYYYQGTSVVIGNQIYYFGADDVFGAITMGILTGVPRQRAEIVEGVILTTLRDAGASPVASSMVMRRLHDLSGDQEVDEKLFRSLVEKQKFVAEPESIDPEVVAHLHNASNAPGMIRMLFSQSIARGPVVGS